MDEHIASARVPGLGELQAEALALLREFDPRKLCYLDREGRWAENPEKLRDRISHFFLFHVRSLSEEGRASFFTRAFSPFLTESLWPIVGKVAASRAAVPPSPAFTIFETLLWIL